MNNLLSRIFDDLESKVSYNKEYSKISKIHKYWSRKPWYIIEKYIENYSEVGDTVLDPFCGSGSTGVETILKGRNFIGTDLNPISVLISKGTLDTSINLDVLEDDFNKIKKLSQKKIQELYVSDIECSNCNEYMQFTNISIGPAYNDTLPAKIFCPNFCKKNSKIEISRDRYNNLYPSKKKLETLQAWVPSKEFPKEFYKDRFSYKGISKVSDMYTSRNLTALGFLLEVIKSINSNYEHLLLLSFTNTVLHATKLKSNNVRPLGVNNYWIPDDYIEENVWFRFEDRFNNLLVSKKTLLKRMSLGSDEFKDSTFRICKESALNIELENQVDYIFTDPPYGDAIQYSELSFLWNAWIEKDFEIKEEVIINPKQKKGPDEFKSLLDSSLTKINSVLKDDGYFTLCFQNKDSKIWANVMNTCRNLNFTLHDVKIYDTFGHSYNKGWAAFSPKADIYVTFKKSSAPESSYFTQEVSIEDLIEDTLEYMYKNKVEMDVIKAYDATISLLIWHYFFNTEMNLTESFTIKKFQKIIDTFLSNKKYESFINYSQNQLTFDL